MRKHSSNPDDAPWAAVLKSNINISIPIAARKMFNRLCDSLMVNHLERIYAVCGKTSLCIHRIFCKEGDG